VVADMNSIQESNAEGRRSAVSVSVSSFVIHLCSVESKT